MLDKNGVEIKTGAIVEISGAYFKNDNGLYFVTHSPGDPSWCGSDHCLKKISRKGKISTAKHNLCFWPIAVFVSDTSKRAAAGRWNKEHAEIEVKTVQDMSEVAAFFQAEADGLNEQIRRLVWNFGEDHPEAVQLRKTQAHYEAVARAVME
ncbi:MAG: hypothetical protein Q4C45_05065 [Oscillospiraceae bacterium]|nr:hypothetical protein [Oscillospiraceae bacterium]